MYFDYTENFKIDYQNLPREIQRQTDRKLRLFLQNPRYPSLQVRKLQRDPTGKTWYGRITRDYRFTFRIEGEAYILLNVGKHGKIL